MKTLIISFVQLAAASPNKPAIVPPVYRKRTLGSELFPIQVRPKLFSLGFRVGAAETADSNAAAATVREALIVMGSK